MLRRKWSALARSPRRMKNVPKRRRATSRPGSSASTWKSHLGDEFDGVITGVTNFGVFVQITELMTDGLVHVTSLANDYYKYDAGSQRLVGERSGHTYSLGEEMRIRVQRVDMETRKIDFRPVTELAKPQKQRPPARRASMSKSHYITGLRAVEQLLATDRPTFAVFMPSIRRPIRGSRPSSRPRAGRYRDPGCEPGPSDADQRRSAPSGRRCRGPAQHSHGRGGLRTLVEAAPAGAEIRCCCWLSTAYRTRTTWAPACARPMLPASTPSSCRAMVRPVWGLPSAKSPPGPLNSCRSRRWATWARCWHGSAITAYARWHQRQGRSQPL